MKRYMNKEESSNRALMSNPENQFIDKELEDQYFRKE